MSLEEFFNPRSLAVIGVSHNPEKLGAVIFQNLKKSGYQGKLYGVNIGGGKLGGEVLASRLSEIEETVETAVIVVPRESVPGALEDCGENGVKNVIVITSGFSETDVLGKKLEEEIASLIRRYHFRLLGPNCLGLINAARGINASFAGEMPQLKGLSLVSQSGAVGSALLDLARDENLGISKFVSLGNKVDLGENEILEYLENDPETKVIIAYLESITSGKNFFKLCSRITQKKPLIIIKSGTTEASAQSVSSHTGSIAGEDLPVMVGLREAGVIRTDSLSRLVDLSKAFLFSPRMHGPRVAIVTNAGGLGVMTVDALGKSSLKLATLSKKATTKLRGELPISCSVNNPVDLSGDATSARYSQVLETIVREKTVDGLIVIITPQLMTDSFAISKIIASVKKSGKPIAAVLAGGQRMREAANFLKSQEIPVYSSPEEAVYCLSKQYQFSVKASRPFFLTASVAKATAGREKTAAILREAEVQERKVLNDFNGESYQVLSYYGLETVQQEQTKNPLELPKIAASLGYPVVLKAGIRGLLHKTEIGGVIVDIRNEAELQSAHHQLEKKLSEKRLLPQADYTLARCESGLDIFLGARNDPNFGPMVIFGMGGIYVEALRDLSYRLAPINETEARKMIGDLQVSKILTGYRTGVKYHLESLVEAIAKLSKLISDFPEIKEIDINPLKLSEKKAVVVDAKIILE